MKVIGGARPRLGTLYVVLVLIMVAQGIWWSIFLTRTTDREVAEHTRRIQAEMALARSLIERQAIDVEDARSRFPELRFDAAAGSVSVTRDPGEGSARLRELKRERRMVAWEGAFFVACLALGSIVLLRAHAEERVFRRAHELFLAGVTHEFRTPLASARLSAETLERDDLGEPSRRAVLKRLSADVDRLESLVGQVLAVTRETVGAGGDLVTVDLADVVRHVLDELAPLIEHAGTMLETHLPAGHLVVARPTALTVAIRNVVKNAVEHGRRPDAPPRVHLSLRRDGDAVHLVVRDHGPGVPRADRRRVFRAFVRGSGRRSGAGAGLGLYLVRRNVEAMGGRVVLERPPDGGAAVRLTLRAGAGA